MVVDFRFLNKITIKDGFKPPLIADILDQVKIFCYMDDLVIVVHAQTLDEHNETLIAKYPLKAWP